MHIDWTHLASTLPIEPGDLVWAHTPKGLARVPYTRDMRNVYLALDEASTRAAFDKKLAALYRLPDGTPALARVPGTDWVLACEGASIVLPIHLDDPLVVRCEAWRREAKRKQDAMLAYVLAPAHEACEAALDAHNEAKAAQTVAASRAAGDATVAIEDVPLDKFEPECFPVYDASATPPTPAETAPTPKPQGPPARRRRSGP